MSRQSADREHRVRLFYALLFPEDFVSSVSDLIRELEKYDLNRGVRWSPPQNLHLTLRFLGEVSREQVVRAEDLPKEIPPPGSIRLMAGQTDAFPSLTKPRVLTLSVSGVEEHHTARLLRLHAQLEEVAVELGLPAEKRRFRPHITLGRVRRGRQISNELAQALEAEDFLTDRAFECGRLSLMESHLGEKGARYEEIRNWPLETGV